MYSQSAAARTVALAAGDAVRTRHGLVLLTTRYSRAPGLSRVVVPGADTPDAVDARLRAWAARPGTHRRGARSRVGTGGGFTAALENLADHTDAATTSTTAKMVGYPATGLDLGNEHESSRTVLLAIAGLTVAVLVGLTPAFLVQAPTPPWQSAGQSSHRKLRHRLRGGTRWRERHGMKPESNPQWFPCCSSSESLDTSSGDRPQSR